MDKVAEKKRAVTGLKKMLTLVKKGWTKGTLARNKYGNPVHFNSKSACKWCAEGALARAIPEYSSKACNALWNASREATLVMFNDLKTTKKSDVIALIERAIKLVK